MLLACSCTVCKDPMPSVPSCIEAVADFCLAHAATGAPNYDAISTAAGGRVLRKLCSRATPGRKERALIECIDTSI